MTAVKYVSAIICFGLGVALAFAAAQSMYSSVGLGDNPGGPIVAGVGAMRRGQIGGKRTETFWVMPVRSRTPPITRSARKFAGRADTRSF